MISIKKMVDFLVKNEELDLETAKEHFSAMEFEEE